MCTAVSLTADKHHYFARTLDLEYHHNESVTLTPRRYPFSFTDGSTSREHPALLGMAYVMNDYPLYYDAMNEHGLCMAGLAFRGYGRYAAPDKHTHALHIAPWEFIPYLLTRCATVADAKTLLANTDLVDIPFTETLPNQPMHWILSDRQASIVIELDPKGHLIRYDNPAGVMTNAPPFPEITAGLPRIDTLTAHPTYPMDTGISIRGGGALGLPGDWTSQSRFIRAAFLSRHMQILTPFDALALLDSVKIPRGAVIAENGDLVTTVYSAVMDPASMRYLCRTEEDPSPRSISPTPLQLRGNQCIRVPLSEK